MSDPNSPQTPSAEELRDERGRIRKGFSGNPGGQSKLVAKARKELLRGSPEAARYLNRVVAGEETTEVPTKHGVETIAVPAKDRIAAAKVVLEFTLTKPKQEADPKDSRSGPFSGLTPEQLLEWAKEQ